MPDFYDRRTGEIKTMGHLEEGIDAKGQVGPGYWARVNRRGTIGLHEIAAMNQRNRLIPGAREWHLMSLLQDQGAEPARTYYEETTVPEDPYTPVRHLKPVKDMTPEEQATAKRVSRPKNPRARY